ncbi:LLM class flavin-dependent oxidoreductase [Microbacterium sp. gxy059]|uniref:LLM class flavin-dependent oxidoreductase n=1 Tax=Microbacterium sp. gxy059 TaxID=2957199 RepID=UPI003D96C23D
MAAEPTERAVVGLSLSPTWLRGAAWRRGDSDVEAVLSGDALIAAAQAAEAAGAAFVFRPDHLALDPSVLREWPGATGLDPIVLMTAIARETDRIGLVPTYSTRFAPPYLVARELQSLDRISRGRAGWNAVTSRAGAGNFSDAAAPADDGYRDARDMIAVVRRLQASYPASALRIDREGGVFADPESTVRIEPAGRFDVSGPLTVPAWRDDPMPLLHAGGSPASRELAAADADAIFAMTADVDAGAALREDLAERTAAWGREPGAVRVLPGLVLCLAESRIDAEELYAQARASTGGGAAHATVVGTPQDAVDEIIRRLDAGAADGVIALPYGHRGSIDLLAERVIPTLAARGRLVPPTDDLRAAMRGGAAAP